MKKILSINDVSKKELLTGESDCGFDGLLLVSGSKTLLFDFDYAGGYNYSVKIFNSLQWAEKGIFADVLSQLESKRISEVKIFAKAILENKSL